MRERATVVLAAAVLAGCSGADARTLLSSTTSPPAASASSDAGEIDATTSPAASADDDATAAPAPADAGASSSVVAAPPLPSLHVVGNRIYDNDAAVSIIGVHRAGTEYSCVHGTGFFDGPSDVASVQAIKSWTGVDAVRVPLNEDCWLGINGVASDLGGAAYQAAISTYVGLLLENGLYAILDLHWSAPGAELATGLSPMPDVDHSVTFWSQVAAAYRGNLGVAFELFNEPDPSTNDAAESDADWECWRDGSGGGDAGGAADDAGDAGDAGACPNVPFAAVGMQTLVSTVRAAGAKNLLLLGGIVSANGMSQWAAYKPVDPANNLAAAWHVYDDRPCSDAMCFNAKVAPLAMVYPVVATEMGETDCSGTFITTAAGLLDGAQQGYLAFTWDAWSGNCQSLISDYTGTPTNPFGLTYKTHVAALAEGGVDP